ncbi:hypothetical protein [Faecalibacillus intestinalis]|uniref:hypothetical protein n=1 Tax=Faecalibacillus intestinalis TaxID=1982626 RepID=UPI0039930A52
MGVWVRSQSSNWLVFASEFYIKTKDGKNGISDVLTTDNQPLTIYSSYKKALKVIGMIQNFIKTRVNEDMIFQMPQDEEVKL